MEEKKDIKPIDLSAIIKKLWAHRKKYYRVLPATLVITYLFMLCFPRYYRSSVSMAPETSGTSISGSLESLASSFGLGGALGKLNTTDAIYAEIYPEVVASKNFIAELMTVDVMTQDGSVKCNYYTYIRDHQAAPWWISVFESIKKMFSDTKPDTYEGKGQLSVFSHTKKQSIIFDIIKDNITCKYDKKTDIFSIIVKDQDPLVSATMAEATSRKLQEFIVKYRTNKARVDYEYYKKLCEESKADYEEALAKYAASADAHTKTVLAVYQSQLESLENDMQAKYNIYTAISAQMQASQAKLQEATPAFTVIESASVPHKPAGPKRMIISIFVTILAFFVVSGKILMKKAASE